MAAKVNAWHYVFGKVFMFQLYIFKECFCGVLTSVVPELLMHTWTDGMIRLLSSCINVSLAEWVDANANNSNVDSV